jgi:uncharacterized protein
LKKLLYLGVGWISVVFAIAGLILPILPTTPMLLVAIWAFSRSSPELAERIRLHRVVGPPIRNWEDNGAISLQAKALALFIMGLMGGWLWYFGDAPTWLAVLITAILVGVAAYVGSRPNGAA